MSVELKLDEASQRHVLGQLEKLKQQGGRSAYSAITKVMFKIINEAQLRLTGRGHIVTSRLKNSLHVETTNKQNFNYTDKEGKSFQGGLNSVSVGEGEVIGGTNVEYADKIETMDSFLYWALKNVNIEQSVGQDMQDFMKFGSGLIQL